MVLAVPVHHPAHPSVTLLRRGAALDAHSIPRLRDLFVHEVWIVYPGLEDLVRFVNPAVLAAYRELTTSIGLALDTAMVQSRVELDFYAYKTAVMSVIEQLIEHPHAAVFVAELVGGERPFVRHAGNVCTLSLLMGLRLEFYLVRERARLKTTDARDISGLGVGAIFHDIGMSRLEQPVLDRWNATRDESDLAWQRHAQIGFEMVRGDVDPAAAAVVLNHHQRFDGSGFPGRADVAGMRHPVAGSDVHVFARIVGAADLFDRLRHPAHAPGADARKTPSIPAVRALNLLRQKPHRERLDPVVFLALLSVAPPYPPGSLVTITGGRMAVVVDWTPADPCRPTVEVLDASVVPCRAADRKRERIDLRARPTVRITSIDGHDVTRDNFFPTFDGEFDLARVARVLTNRAEGDLKPAAA